MDKYRILQTSLVVALVLSLVLVIWLGLNSGHARAQSKLIVLNTEALAQGIGFFQSDYDRYPTELEFETEELMGSYFEPWPVTQFSSDLCNQSIEYKNFRFDEYSLNVCLPSGYRGLPKGYSEFTVSK